MELDEKAVKKIAELEAENALLRSRLADRENTITLLKAREWARDADEVRGGHYIYRVPLAS